MFEDRFPGQTLLSPNNPGDHNEYKPSETERLTAQASDSTEVPETEATPPDGQAHYKSSMVGIQSVQPRRTVLTQLPASINPMASAHPGAACSHPIDQSETYNLKLFRAIT